MRIQEIFGPVTFTFLVISGLLSFSLCFWYHTKYILFFKVSETDDKNHLGVSVGRLTWQRNWLLTLQQRGGEELVEHFAVGGALPSCGTAGKL